MQPRVSPTIRVVALIVLLCFLAGCTTVPDRFATAQEIYPPHASFTPLVGLPSGSFQKDTFKASFEEVFRAVTVAVPQAQFNVESTDKAKGVILATRVVMDRNSPRADCILCPNMQAKQYSYAIIVKETGRKTSEVAVLAKVQGSCTRQSGLYWISLSIVTFGIAIPHALDSYRLEKSRCDWAALVRWPGRGENPLQEMPRLLTLTRNHLVAAGALQP